MTNNLIAQLAAEAAKKHDQTEVSQEREWTPPAEGAALARFIEYIELGKHEQAPYKGQPKPDVDKVRLTFELLTMSKNRQDIREIEVDGKKVQIADRISFNISMKLGERARFKKLFLKMARGRDTIKHFAQMLGEPFLLNISHTKSDDGKFTYVNIENADGWQVSAPRVQTDPLDATSWKDIPVREALSPLKIFIFDMPSKETWDSLFIDGTRTVKEGENEVEKSRNWLQEMILSAKNYKSSELETLLNGLGGLKVDPVEQKEVKSDQTIAESALDELAEAGAEETSAVDDLSSIGL